MKNLNEINEKLEKVYNEKWNDLSNELQKYNSSKDDATKVSNPLLLKLGEHFNFDFDNRGNKKIIMCFGQETNVHGGIFSEKEEYEYLINQNNCNDKQKGYHRFCGVIVHKWLKENSLELFGIDKDDLFVIWNNIRKISTVNPITRGKIDDELGTITEKYFKVIPDELNIIKPDLLFFCTGPNGDGDITRLIGEMEAPYESYFFDIKNRKSKGELRCFYVNGFKAVRGYYPKLISTHWKSTKEVIKKNQLFK